MSNMNKICQLQRVHLIIHFSLTQIIWQTHQEVVGGLNTYSSQVLNHWDILQVGWF